MDFKYQRMSEDQNAIGLQVTASHVASSDGKRLCDWNFSQLDFCREQDIQFRIASMSNEVLPDDHHRPTYDEIQ